MAQRLNHVSTLIAKFDTSETSSSINEKPPIAPKPIFPRKSPVFQVSPQGNASCDSGRCLPENDSLAVISEKQITSSKRKTEWPPKKCDYIFDETQSDESSEKIAHCMMVSDENSDADMANSSVGQNSDADMANSSVGQNSDADVSNSSVEIEGKNSSNVNQSQISGSSESSVCGDEVENTTSTASSQSISGKSKKNYAKVTEEIVNTERKFVEDLSVLYECYQAMVKVNTERELDLEKRIEDVFSDFVPIYRLHSDTFLPIMEKHYAVEEFWVGRVFHENNFIVKTYKPFIVKQTDNEKTLLELLKCPFISEAIDDVLKNHKRMMGCANGYNVIFQRITRYSLLLKEYIKNLPNDCPDQAVAMLAMGKINDAAFQLNETKRNADDFNTQVLNALDRIARGRQLELQPWEKFIKEGPVEKISARSITRVQARYLFLFSGRLLLCESSLTTYAIKTQMEVASMKIEEINDPNKHPNSFRLRGKEKNFDLKFETEDAENDWRDALNRVIAADRERKESFMRVGLTEENLRSLGNQAPLWVKDQDCSMCMLCCVQFTFNNRRHHCRACGQIVCGQCSNYRHTLECLSGKSARVCKNCKERLSGSEGTVTEEESVKSVPDAAIESYLHFADKTLQFKEKYAILRTEGFVELKAKYKDRKAWKTIPIVGYSLTKVTDLENCFKLSHPACEYYFMCKNEENYVRWFGEMKEVLAQFEA